MVKVVVTPGAIRRATLRPNYHHQQTNTAAINVIYSVSRTSSGCVCPSELCCQSLWYSWQVVTVDHIVAGYLHYVATIVMRFILSSADFNRVRCSSSMRLS